MQSFLLRHAQLVRFLVVGVSGVLVSMAVFQLVWLVLPRSGIANNLAATAGWAVAVASNFVLHERWTFVAGDKQGPALLRLARYYMTAAIGLGIQLVVLNVTVKILLELPLQGLLAELVLPWKSQIGNLVGIGTATAANWTLARRWVFK
jgi:putative flippase GtrA